MSQGVESGVRSGLLATVVTAVLVLAPALDAEAADTDQDGLWDGFESRFGVTDPNSSDTDRDGVIDSAEDSDGDGLSNLGEQRFRTDPGKRDTDGDGTPDADEDNNGDGRSNGRDQDKRRVPANLEPSLGNAVHSLPPLRRDCQTEQRHAVPVVCGFGRLGATKIVLVGDSHAMMWSSPIKQVAASKDWRFLTMTKTACPPLLGLYTRGQVAIDGGVTCQRWRRNIIDRLNAYPPDLIIITHSDRYALSTRRGTTPPRSRWKSLWSRALERTLAALPESSQVLVLGDVPHNRLDPRRCLKHHPGDMSSCVTRKPSSRQRQIEFGLRDSAKASGAQYRTLFGKICSYDPCPVVQGNILMWRNRGHVTDQFAVRLQPSIRSLIEEALR